MIFISNRLWKPPCTNTITLKRHFLIFGIALLAHLGTLAQTPVANRVKAVVKSLPAQAQVVAKYTDNQRHCLYYTLRNRLFRYDVKTDKREEISFSPNPYSSIITTWLSADGNAFFIALDRKNLVSFYLDNGQELWRYDSHTKQPKRIGVGFSISHLGERITIKRASRCLNPQAAQSRQRWMVCDHHYDGNGTPLGKGEEYKLK